ncbi:MOG interacting and ectopic P-granules protein 1-like isoform X2 [Mytilus trossulus]
MEVSETLNGNTTGETIMKDPSALEKDNLNQNGYTDDKLAEKVNGNSDLHNKNTSNDINAMGDINAMETSENETNEHDNGHDGDENLNKETLETRQNELKVEDKLKVEEELDNSTATSNISDISPYEDSEQSMDVDTKEELDDKGESDHDDAVKEKDDIPTCSGKEVETDQFDEITEKYDMSTCSGKEVETKNGEFEDGSEKANLDEKEIKNAEEINKDQTKLQDSEYQVSTGDEKMKDMKEDHEDCEKVESEQESTTLDKDSSENGGQDEDANNSANNLLTKKIENVSDELKMNGGEKSGQENESQSKSIEKVTDIDGSEILITINEEIEDSESENEISASTSDSKNKDKTNDKAEKEETKQLKDDSNKDKKDSKEIHVVVINESPDKNEKMVAKVSKPVILPQPAPMFKSKQIKQPPIVTGASQVRFPVLPGSSIQYFVPSSIQSMPNTQQKYINVGGQQILITIPTSSMGTVLNSSIIGNAGSSVLGIQSKPSPAMTMGFPLPNHNKNPLDKTIDVDIPQASWEQLELIKYEVLSRKPDNAFWGGLANVSKKADLSSASKLLFDLGSDLVKELAYEQIVQVQRKKDEADLLNASEKESLLRMKKVVEELKNKLEYLHDIPKLKCKCGFTTESKNVMYLHKQYPHVSYNTPDKSALLSCPHCKQTFQGKIAEDMFKAHIEKEHNIVARSNHKSNLWPCNLCSFEGANRNTIMKHKLKCEKNFKEHINQAPHHVDINLSLKNIFYKFQVHNKKLQLQQQAQQARKIAQIDRPDTRGIPIAKHQPAIIKPKTNQSQAKPPLVVNPNRPIMTSHFQGPTPASTAYAMQSAGTRFVTAPVQKQPQPLKPASANKPTVNQLLRTQQNVNANTNTRPGFEVCEICGGYVKDRMSLRIHFFYAHKIEMPAHVFSKPLAPLFCNICNERFWTSQGFTKHKTSAKHLHTVKQNASATNQCWICHQKPENLYSHLHKFHRLTTGECMALKRCMFCGTLSQSRKELELHMAATHGVLIKGEENKASTIAPGSSVIKPQPQSSAATKNLSTVVTGGSSGMVRNNFCVFCSSQFQDNTKLTLHCLSVHATCKKCGMVVNKMADLARHVCKMASKTCNICGLKNLKPAGLLKHLESHTKPCSVALKRLSPSQINIATGGKFMRLDPRLRTRNARTTASIIEGEIKMEQTKGLTVAMNFDKPRKGKVIIDLSGKTDVRKEEVVIESDNDSDVIIQEEERTEIVLDSDDDDDDVKSEKNQSESQKNDLENKDEREKERNIKKCETTKDENHTKDRESDNTEIGGKGHEEKDDKSIVKEENDLDKPSVNDESDKDNLNVKEENDEDKFSEKEENDIDKPSVKEENIEDKLSEKEENIEDKPSEKEENIVDQPKELDENYEKCENMEENKTDMTTDSKIGDDSVEMNKGELTEKEEHSNTSIDDTNSSKNALENEDCDSVQSEISTDEAKNLAGSSRKRSHSDCENSDDPEEDSKKRKTDEDSDSDNS